jgi:hypothetical protein
MGLGYRLVGTNSAGHNAFFIREDLILPPLKRLDPAESFTVPTYRDGRDEQGNLSFDNFTSRQKLLQGLPVLNSETLLLESI